MVSLDPVVSVIIPFFNREKYTLEAIESAVCQSYKNLEIILINDGSTDPINKIKEYKSPVIRFIDQANQGPSAARNYGMRLARGQYICFLDSDDLFLEGKIEYQVSLHESNPKLWLSHTSYQRMQFGGLPLEVVNSGTFSGQVFPKIIYYCPIATPTVMINRKVIENGIFYDTRFCIAEDLLFYSKIAQYSEILGINQVLSNVRVSEQSNTNVITNQKIGLQNIIQTVENDQFTLTEKQKTFVISNLYESLSIVEYLNRKYTHSFSCFWISLKKSTNKLNSILRFIKKYLLVFRTKMVN